MSITVYNPAGIETIQDSKFVWVPSLAKIEAATVAELNAGTAFTCALTKFSNKSDASESEDKRICSRNAKKRPGPITYAIDDLDIIIDDPQKPDAFIDSLEPGVHGYIVEFPHLSPDTDIASGQRYYAWQVTVKKKEPGDITTSDGELFVMNVGWSVQDRTLKGVVAGS
ncbi:hypothetical protein FYJ43_04370 [Cutibacterium sp. WCA-380-WT-3A]|uniref:Phage tail protein n=1 Tax=Cutibacterium porci TaxID=2605781 RepID=A0A7K0J5V5_9ACTN|nr:hypothetical protein [Cutibacterium porci]MSS45292.1 hypothetical protein [Cutibacterium porci]